MWFILALLAIEIIGVFFVLFIFKRGQYPYTMAELFSLSFFVGTGIIVCMMFLYNCFGVAFTLSNLIIVPVLLSIVCFSRYVAAPGRLNELIPIGSSPEAWSRIERLLVLGIFVQFLWTVFLALPIPVHSHDAVANYALKAKIFYLAEGIPQGFFSWSEAVVAHSDYPLHLPLLMTWIYNFTGFNDLIVNMVMPIVYLAFVTLFYTQMKKFFRKKYALLTVFILATIPQLVDYATIIHTDLILTAFVTCAFVYFVIYIRTNERTPLVLSALLFGFSLWIKNEAVVFVSGFAVMLVLHILRKDHVQRERVILDAGLAIILVVAIAFPWFITKISSAASNSDIDFSRLTAQRLWQNIKDIPILLNLLQQEVFGPKKWNIFWILFFAGVIWKREMLFKGECFYVALFLGLSATGYFIAYMLTTGNTLFFYVNTTISRFMIHFCGIATFLLAKLVYKDIRT